MKVAFVSGRFEPIHKGHQLLIDEAFKLEKNVAILICSSQESRTRQNPLSYEERKELIKKIYPKAIIIPVPDMGIGNNEKWGDFLLDTLKKYDCEPTFFVTGEEERRESWFRKEILKEMKIIKISRSKIRCFSCNVFIIEQIPNIFNFNKTIIMPVCFRFTFFLIYCK